VPEPALPAIGAAGAPELEVALESVSLGGREVLKDVAFACRAGTRVAVLGPNGAGKTTLLRSIVSLIPYRGSIRIGGEPLANLPALERARRLAYVPQRSSLDAPLSVSEVVMMGRFCHQDVLGRVRSRDREVVLGAMRAMDVESLAERPFTELSGGEQRRTLLARALATEARVILLDEPTAALDIGHSLALHEQLASLAAEGKVVINVLHNIADAERHSDLVCLLRAGRLISFAPPPISNHLLSEVYGVEVVEELGRTFRLSDPVRP
jgi:iron complex transport system ATP-binding protein